MANTLSSYVVSAQSKLGFWEDLKLFHMDCLPRLEAYERRVLMEPANDGTWLLRTPVFHVKDVVSFLRSDGFTVVPTSPAFIKHSFEEELELVKDRRMKAVFKGLWKALTTTPDGVFDDMGKWLAMYKVPKMFYRDINTAGTSPNKATAPTMYLVHLGYLPVNLSWVMGFFKEVWQVARYNFPDLDKIEIVPPVSERLYRPGITAVVWKGNDFERRAQYLADEVSVETSTAA